ncbi:hypothetical protein RclHR1_00560012 [Rhizophagus clarus]|nr:hypothetical protein RclHR1_00560012 [Rhizophagus clarus]
MEYLIDKNVRKWDKTPLAAKIFNRLILTSSYQPLSMVLQHNSIDWDATGLWLKYNPYESPTSKTLLKNLSHRNKSTTHVGSPK